MCGIVGYLNLDNRYIDRESKLGHSLLNSMCESIYHRGPDEDGKMIDGPVALGMRRLSIIDLSSGQQPISNEDDSISIVFNGEIYNFQELQSRLRESGHKLRTNSDTETIVHLYEDFGVDCLQHLEGMFAFAIWDRNKERLFIARDRMGEKPLYWSIINNQLVFSSELKGILQHPGAVRELNPLALQQYLALEYVPAPYSMLKGINKLMPAHCIVAEKGKVSTFPYWSLPRPQENDALAKISEKEAKDRLEELLTESIKLRLISDVPLGVFLSGGIDSSIIAAIAQKQVSHKLKTFSVSFADASFDESPHAKRVADHLGCDHTVIPFDPDTAQETLFTLSNYLDEPIGDAAIIPTYLLSKMTKKSVTVALAGEGGDEIMGGYPTYLAHRIAGTWNKVPSAIRKGVVEPLANMIPVSHNYLSFDYKLKRFLANSDLPPIRRQLRWMGSIPLSLQSNLLRREILKQNSTIYGEEDLLPHLRDEEIGWSRTKCDVADIIMRLDIRAYLADDLLFKADRATMAASLEGRLPFLAHPLVEFAVALPASLKYKGKTSKYLLRRLADDYLPEDITKRPKQGFGIPVAKWLRKDFKPMVDHYLGAEYLKQQGIFSPSTMNALVKEHDDGSIDRRKELWTILMFQMWWDKFLNTGTPSESNCDSHVHSYAFQSR